MSSLDPLPPRSRTQAKPCFIPKRHRFPKPKNLKFFYTLGEIVSPLFPRLEDRNNWFILADILNDAFISELVVLASSARSASLDTLSAWDRSIEPGSSQNFKATVQNGAPPPGQFWAASVTAGPKSFFSSELSIPLNLLFGSNDSSS